MNRLVDLPPPPGTEDDIEQPVTVITNPPVQEEQNLVPESPKEPSKYLFSPDKLDRDKDRDVGSSVSHTRRHSPDRYRRRSRSRSYSRGRDRRYRRRSRSRSRSRRRSRSRYRRRRRSSYSRSRSRSRSRGRRHGRYRRRYFSPHSASRSRSRSRSRTRTHRNRKLKSKTRSLSRSMSRAPSISRAQSKSKSPAFNDQKGTSPPSDVDTKEVDMKIEEDEEDDVPKEALFKNDGSFLEMFKKMQEQQKKQQEEEEQKQKPLLPAFGKRRGGKVLKTGMVQKKRTVTEEETNAQDAWSIYMKEVRRYKEACCDDDSKTRPLVK
nr:unnamed protein product [Callosobruchus analis]